MYHFCTTDTNTLVLTKNILFRDCEYCSWEECSFIRLQKWGKATRQVAICTVTESMTLNYEWKWILLCPAPMACLGVWHLSMRRNQQQQKQQVKTEHFRLHKKLTRCQAVYFSPLLHWHFAQVDHWGLPHSNKYCNDRDHKILLMALSQTWGHLAWAFHAPERGI